MLKVSEQECRELMEAMRNDGEHGFVDWLSDRKTEGPHYILYEEHFQFVGLYLFDRRPHQWNIRLQTEAITHQNIRSAWDLIKEVRARG